MKVETSLCLAVPAVLFCLQPVGISPVRDVTLSVAYSSPAPNTRTDAEQFSTATPPELPFRLSSGFLIEVTGRVAAQGSLKFLLDTGSTISIVDSRIANQIKLPRRPAESLGFGKIVTWEVATVPEVQFGQIKARNVQMLVGNLPEFSAYAKGVDAVIGMDLLKLTDFSIDYDAKKIIFHSSQREYSGPASEPFLDFVILELLVQGHPVRLIVDSGFPGLLLYDERLRRQVPGLRTLGSPTEVSLGGTLQGKHAVLPDVVFGRRNDNISVLLMQAPPPDTLPGIDGIVGLTPLKAHKVRFDFVAKRVSWK